MDSGSSLLPSNLFKRNKSASALHAQNCIPTGNVTHIELSMISSPALEAGKVQHELLEYLRQTVTPYGQGLSSTDLYTRGWH